MGRASDALPWKPYAYHGGDEPPAVTAARQRWRAQKEQLDALAVGGEGLDPLGRRELAGDDDAGPAHDQAPPDQAEDVPVARCKRCDYLVTAVGHKVKCGG